MIELLLPESAEFPEDSTLVVMHQYDKDTEDTRDQIVKRIAGYYTCNNVKFKADRAVIFRIELYYSFGESIQYSISEIRDLMDSVSKMMIHPPKNTESFQLENFQIADYMERAVVLYRKLDHLHRYFTEKKSEIMAYIQKELQKHESLFL